MNPRTLAVDVAKAVLPRRLKEYLDASAHQRTTVATFMEYLERDPAFAAYLAERSRERWRAAAPDAELTWGRRPSGQPFMMKAFEFRRSTSDTRVLEIGPGYGRLAQATLDLGLPFKSWTGVDVSEQNLAHLSTKYSGENFRWVRGDIETIELDREYDLCVSSLVLQHIFPTLERAASNIATALAPGGALFFDCREGEYQFFEEDGVTWIRMYTKDELKSMLQNAGFSNVRFDNIRHALGYVRLCAFATKP